MKQKSIKQEIMHYFLQNPSKKLRVREIEREVGVALPSAIRYTKELVKEGILRVEKISNVTLFSADRISKRFLLEKRLFNLRMIHESGLIPYLVEELSNPTIILFGSYNRGEDLELSDIDVYVQTPSKKKLSLQKFNKKLGREVDCFFSKSIHDIKNIDLANNIVNGTVLNGFVEVLK